MSRTLRDDLAIDYYDTQLNPDEFGEWVTYYPADGGASRRLVAVISERQRAERGDLRTHETDVITVLLGADPTHTKGGVSRPVRRADRTDRLRRDGDTEQQLFAFTGEVIRRPVGGWLLRFSRPRLLELAGNETRG